MTDWKEIASSFHKNGIQLQVRTAHLGYLKDIRQICGGRHAE